MNRQFKIQTIRRPPRLKLVITKEREKKGEQIATSLGRVDHVTLFPFAPKIKSIKSVQSVHSCSVLFLAPGQSPRAPSTRLARLIMHLLGHHLPDHKLLKVGSARLWSGLRGEVTSRGILARSAWVGSALLCLAPPCSASLCMVLFDNLCPPLVFTSSCPTPTPPIFSVLTAFGLCVKLRGPLRSVYAPSALLGFSRSTRPLLLFRPLRSSSRRDSTPSFRSCSAPVPCRIAHTDRRRHFARTFLACSLAHCSRRAHCSPACFSHCLRPLPTQLLIARR